MRMQRFRVLLVAAMMVMGVLVPGQVLAGTTVVVTVSATADAAANGKALTQAIEGITDAGAEKRYVVHLAPGVYSLGASIVTMKPYVSLVGSGELATTLTFGADVNGNSGRLMLAGNTEVQNLTVDHKGGEFVWAVVGKEQQDGVALRNVTIRSTASGLANGVYLYKTPAQLIGVTIAVENKTGPARGIEVFESPSVLIRDADIRVQGSGEGLALLVNGTGYGVEVEESNLVGTAARDPDAQQEGWALRVVWGRVTVRRSTLGPNVFSNSGAGSAVQITGDAEAGRTGAVRIALSELTTTSSPLAVHVEKGSALSIIQSVLWGATGGEGEAQCWSTSAMHDPWDWSSRTSALPYFRDATGLCQPK